jgi:hypothetical protein
MKFMLMTKTFCFVEISVIVAMVLLLKDFRLYGIGLIFTTLRVFSLNYYKCCHGNAVEGFSTLWSALLITAS